MVICTLFVLFVCLCVLDDVACKCGAFVLLIDVLFFVTLQSPLQVMVILTIFSAFHVLPLLLCTYTGTLT